MNAYTFTRKLKNACLALGGSENLQREVTVQDPDGRRFLIKEVVVETENHGSRPRIVIYTERQD